MVDEQDTTVAPEADIAHPVQVTVEEAGPALKRLKIEIPEARVQETLETHYDQILAEAQIPGFRPGRAPRRLIERRFGEAIRDDSKAELIGEAYREAIQSHDLNVISEPDIKDAEHLELPESGPLSLEVEVEVSPDVELPELGAITVTRPPAEVSEEEVEAELEQIRERYGQMERLEEAEIAEGDFLTADIRIFAGHGAGEDAEVIAEHPGSNILVPGESRDFRGHAAGIVIEDLGRRLVGAQPGQTIEIETTGPPRHENEAIAGKPITLRVQLGSVERVSPAPIESVVEQAGLEDEATLRSHLRESLESQKQSEQKEAMRRQLRDHLTEQVSIEVPEKLSAKQAGQVLERRRMELAYQGRRAEEIEQQMAEIRAESEEEARRELKLFFILMHAAREFEVEVTENELNGQVAMMAMRQNERPETYRQKMEERGELESLRIQLQEVKTLDHLLEQVSVEEEGSPGASEPAPETPDPGLEAPGTDAGAGAADSGEKT